MTLMIRPSVAGPTGTEMPAPVSTTSWPRTRPSVVSMAMVRTVRSPRTCATCPTLFFMLRLPSKRLGAGDDLDQLAGDVRLAGAVVVERQLADHLARVARGVVHRAHLAAVEAGRILEQGAV